MVDKVVKLHNGVECYVIDELVEERNRYVFATQVDNTNGETTDNYLFLKEVYENGNLYFEDIKDKQEFNRIASIFIGRLRRKNS